MTKKEIKNLLEGMSNYIEIDEISDNGSDTINMEKFGKHPVVKKVVKTLKEGGVDGRKLMKLGFMPASMLLGQFLTK